MTQLLARWLKKQQKQLVERWIEVLEREPVVASGAPDLSDELSPADHDEQRVMLDALYSGIIQAANGNNEPLDKSLDLLRIFHNHGGENELPRHLGLIAQLRRIVWDALSSDLPNQPDWYAHGVELDQIIEYATVKLSARWAAFATTTSRELYETRLLVESLTRDAEASDRTTLHVSTINEISRSLASTLDQASQIKLVGEKLLVTLESVSVAIWQSDLAAGCLRVVGLWEPGNNAHSTPTPEWFIRSDAEDDLIARAFRSGEMQLDREASAEQQGEWYREPYVVLAMPLISQANVQGVIVLQELSGQVLTARAEQEFIRSAASQAAIAFESARLYEEVRRFNTVLEQRIAERTHELQVERDTLETLNTIALEISSTLDEHLLMQHSLSAIARLIGAEHGSISLLERETEHLVDRAVLGRTEGVGYTRFPIGRGIIGWVAQQRRAVLAPDVSKDPRWIELPEDEEHGRKQRGGSLIAVPLVAHHELQGVLVLSHDQVGFFNSEHQRLVEAAANQIATGIYNALIYQQLEQDLLRRYEMQQIQQQAVSQSQAILQSLSDGVIVCDSFGSVLTVNPAAERILERPIDELLIWNMPELFRRLMGRRAEELPVEDLIGEPRDAQGNPRFFNATIQIATRVVSISLNPVLSNEKHTPMGALAVFRDITREVESDRLKTEFIGTVSHELRTPMTSIKGFTQLLVMGSLGPVNETQREFLGIIQTNAERMIAIINDLLDITKIETGTVELDLRSLHLAEALSNVVMELQPKIQERSHELSISIPPGLPLVRADQRRFNQILFNLLSNAVKYTQRSGQLALEAREVTQEAVPEALREGLKAGRYVQIDIRDNGVGIARDELERIFERFYRTENPLKVEAGGTGLGLSLVRPLVQLFGGRIWVESVLGEGSTFRMILPAI